MQQTGIKHTAQLFPNVLTRQDRREFAKQNQIGEEDLLELTRLTDVARLKWVGPKFARLLIESEYDTAEKIADADQLYAALVRVNAERGLYQEKFGVEDMRSWVNGPVQAAPLVIQY